MIDTQTIEKPVELTNFKTPSHMKREFQNICKSKNTQMTSVLNSFIHTFIQEHRNQ